MFKCTVSFLDEYSAFIICPLLLNVRVAFIYSVYIFFLFTSKNYVVFSLLWRLITSSLKFFITYLSLFLKERLSQLYILWKIERYFKILDLLSCVNLLVIQVLQSLLKTVLCWMQFKDKAIQWP